MSYSYVSAPMPFSVFNMLEKVMLQVDYHCFAETRFNYIDPLYKELCLIIAEVLISDPASAVKINGVFTNLSIVQEVYSQINNDHLRLVFNNFNNVSTHVFSKKAYLRTALYNSVFELEASVVNNRVSF
jgi:hypothetical protein